MNKIFEESHNLPWKHTISPILVIEDNPDMLNVYAEICYLYGYSSLLASDGSKGLEIARRRPVSLIICDLYLPDMHGYEVLQCLRQYPATMQTPVVFVTGDIRCKPPADSYLKVLPKPFTLEALLSLISQLVGTEVAST